MPNPGSFNNLAQGPKTISKTIPPDWRLPKGVDRALWQYLHHEELARDYDQSLRDSPLAKSDLDLVFQHADPQKDTLIDLGCGTGRLLAAWEKLGGQGTGVDLSESMLEQARNRLGTDSRIQLVLGNLTDLTPIESSRFDRGACLYSTLGMLRPHQARIDALKAFYRVIKPGGKLLLHAHNFWSNLYHPKGRAFLARKGWRKLLGDREAGDFVNDTHKGLVGLSLHMYTRSELARDLAGTGWKTEQILPLGTDGRPLQGFARRFRAAGWFAIAIRPT